MDDSGPNATEEENRSRPSRKSGHKVNNDQEDVEKQDEDAPQERSTLKITIIMLSLAMALFLAALDTTIVVVALPTISEHFHSTSGYTWIGSAFLLANAAAVPVWGKFSDIFGRKPMLLLANAIFLLGSALAGWSSSIGMLITARAIQGIGGGGLVILVNIVIGDLFSLRRRGTFYGLTGAVWAIASAVGPVIGGLFTDRASWRWCFWINLPLDGAVLFIIFFFLDVRTPRTPILQGLLAIDWIGCLAVVGATLMLLFGLQYGGVSHPWTSATVLCLIISGLLTFLLFTIWESRFARNPVIPMHIFHKPTNLATLSVVFLHGFVFIAGSYYIPLYFQAVRGASPTLSGVYLLPTALCLAITEIGTGIYIGLTGRFLPPTYLGLLFLSIGYGLFINLNEHSNWAKLILYQIISGLGVGPMFQSPMIALQAHIDPREIGTGTATLGFMRQLATSSSVVIGSVVFQNEMNSYAPRLEAVLGSGAARQLGGANVGANLGVINRLPDEKRRVVRACFAQSLSTMWIVYACVAVAALLASLAMKKKSLDQEHVETRTGLEAEEEKVREREEMRKRKREERKSTGG
ncbi:putative major facilitator superfamily transporter [Piedraia hortae CBS 480.64]|uniref:Efflux pump dotC n=1 Tax=Piedraia hortae CBS 480.64 TaxID=1314780 RepID=A0A6A7C1E2_9PEZI|nr:putative major facilitator superfamily transporter [Piedraia hortae CBS 480.64]